jgi:hypothetical protein
VTLTLHAGDADASATSSKTASYYNLIGIGLTTKLYTDTWSEAEVEALLSIISDDNTRTWPSVTAGVGQRIAVAWPSRLSTPTFYISGFEVTFDRVTADVSVTNANGYTENYAIFLTSQDNLGATVVVTA